MLTQGGGGGVLEVYMTGGSDVASYCKPQKIHKPEILDPKKYLAFKFPTKNKITNVHCIVVLILTVFPEQTSLKRVRMNIFLIHWSQRKPKTKSSLGGETPKNTRVFLRTKTIRDRSLDPKKYRACKFSIQKSTSDPPVMYTSSTPPPPLPLIHTDIEWSACAYTLSYWRNVIKLKIKQLTIKEIRWKSHHVFCWFSPVVDHKGNLRFV